MFVLAVLPVLILVTVAQSPPDENLSQQPEGIYIVQDGDSVTMECETARTALCAWKMAHSKAVLGMNISRSLNIGPIEPLPEIKAIDPKSQTDCSINITAVSSKYKGKYTCTPFMVHKIIDPTTVELVVVPKQVAVEFTDDLAGLSEMTVAADKEVTIACEARNALPEAYLVWFLDNHQLFFDIDFSSDEVDEVPQLVTSRSVLRRNFTKEDDGAQLRCEARLAFYSSQETGAAVITVMVQYAPYRAEGSILGTLYGFTADQEGHVTVNFRVNPPPSVMVWTVGGGLEVGAGETSEDGRFSAGPLEEVAGEHHQYSLQLHIKPVKMEDQDVAFNLRTVNAIENTGKIRKDRRLDPESGADKEGHDNPVVDPNGEQQTEATPQRKGNWILLLLTRLERVPSQVVDLVDRLQYGLTWKSNGIPQVR